MTNTYSHAKTELDILSKSATNPNDRPIVEEFQEEILSLCEKFGESGQSGGSAAYVATTLAHTIKKLCLFEPISPITGIEDEWMEVATTDNNKSLYQNIRCGAIFKEGVDGRAYYLDAIHKKAQDGVVRCGSMWISKNDYLSGNRELMICSHAYIKSFPFTPKTFIIDVIQEEISKDNWESYVKDARQLNKVWKIYDKF